MIINSMQKIITLVSVYLWTVIAQCEINKNAVDYIYPSLNSPFVLNVDDLTSESNLIFQLKEQINSTYYYSLFNAPQLIQLNGIIISSTQYMYDITYFAGNIAILVQNQSGYYPYLITTNFQQYLIELLGNSITSNVICQQIMFQNQTILIVSCLNKQQNQVIIYEYDLLNSVFLQPTPQSTNISLLNITNNIISQASQMENQEVDSFAYTSSIINKTVILNFQPSGNYINSTQLNGYLTDMIGIQCIFIIQKSSLFIDQLQYDGVIFKHPPSIFLKMTILYQNRQQVLIATQDSILILDYIKSQFQLISQVPYIDGFVLNQTSKVQLFADDQQVIISDNQTIIIYQQSNTKLFWIQKFQQQSVVQYDSINKIITIITSQSIQAFQLYKPQIQLYFNQIAAGTLNIKLQGLNGNCTYQFQYQVIQNNDTGPYVNYNNKTLTQNFQESELQCVSCLFTGQNLTYTQQSTNINFKYQQIDQYDFFNKVKVQFYYLYSNPLNPQQYAIFYQMENQFSVFAIYCGLPYCYYQSFSQTEQYQIPMFTAKGQIYSFSVRYYEYDTPDQYMFEIMYNVQNQFDAIQICNFRWQYTDNFQCFPGDLVDVKLPPNSNIQLGSITLYNYYLSSNPSYLLLDAKKYQEIQSNYQFVPRQVYYSSLLYNSLVFIDNIYQLNVYELILNGTYLNFITSIPYPIQQGNTSIGIGLLEEAIIITQIDDQGNQFILVYSSNIIRQINLIQQQQPQIISIPAGVKIQFPIVSAYTVSKFYLAWQYNQNYEIAVIQPSNTINNMILSSIYVDGQTNQIQAISQGIYDLLVCQYNQSQIRQITVYDQFYIKLSSNLLLYNDTFENVTINYQAKSEQVQVQTTNQYTFINQIFNIKQIQNYTELQLANTLWFRFLVSDYYNGLVNTYENINNQVSPIGPFIISNNFISVNTSLFLSNYSLANGFNLYFQNNSGVYEIPNFQSGQIYQITKFANNLNCPIIYLNEKDEITSICQSQDSLYQLIVYANNVQQIYDGWSLNLVNGLYQSQILVLNYGQKLLIYILLNKQITCYYSNPNITITKVFLQQQANLTLILQIENSEIIIILDFQVDKLLSTCILNEYQRQIWIDRNQYGSILYLDSQNDLLTVTTTKMSIIYEVDPYNINGRYFVSYSSEMVGILTKIIDDYIIAIYNTTSENNLNYTIIVYSLNQVNKVDFPILTYHNQFNGSPQQFYICDDGTIVYTYSLQNQTGFSYIQVVPYVYVAIDYNNFTQISKNDTYSINNYITEVNIGNLYNQVNITFNITYAGYLGSIFQTQVWSQKSLILTLISALSILGFISFVAFKISTRRKME